MMNYEIRKFEDDLIEMLNNCTLPIEVKRLITKNVLNEITKQADKIIVEEIKDKKKEDENNGLSEN